MLKNFYVGNILARAGRFMDQLGVSLQGETANVYQISKHRRLLSFLENAPQIQGKEVFIAPNASVIGDVSLGEKSSVWYNAVVRGDMTQISIGNATSIGENCVLHASGDQMAKENASPIVIGNNVIIESGVLLQGCVIQNFANIQLGSVILDGAIIGSRSVIAAGSLVPAETAIPAKQLWGGAPAEFIRDLSPKEIESLENLSEQRMKLAAKHTLKHLMTAEDLLDEEELRDHFFEVKDEGKY